METGHFTQVVWKSSVTFGIGKAVVKKGNMKCTFIVARYRPPGNYMGQFQTEVLRGSFTESMCGKLDDMLKDISNAPGAGLPPKGRPVSNPSVSQSTLKTPGTKGNFSSDANRSFDKLHAFLCVQVRYFYIIIYRTS